MRRLIVLILIVILVSTLSSCQDGGRKAVLMPVLERPFLGFSAQDVNIAKSDTTTVTPAADDTKSSTETSPLQIPNNPNELSNQPLPNSTAHPVESDSSIIPVILKQLPYFYPINTLRYISYKADNPDLDYSEAILYVNIGLDNAFFTQVTEVEDPTNIEVLVNKYHVLPEDYVPELVKLPQSLTVPGYGKQYLQQEAFEAFKEMHDDAKLLGLKISACSTYRSIEVQNWIWQNEVNKGRTIADVDSLNSRGGHSEHHTGLAVDVIQSDYSVENSKEFEWYKDNCHKYGFIIRYPKGKESITGYAYEPWHLRYLGKDLAVLVYESGLSYEEYYELNLKPHIAAMYNGNADCLLITQ